MSTGEGQGYLLFVSRFMCLIKLCLLN